jgi:ankyrin repeat protein
MDDPARALTNAIRAFDAGEVRRLLETHSALRATIDGPLTDYGAFGDTALLAAVARDDRPTIDALLHFGADINVKSHWWAGGFSVLDHASAELAPYLIERGAVPEAPAAARLGMIDELVSMIRANPAVVHARGPDGQMALHDASTLEIARLLLEHGADIDALDIDHESTPAQYMLRTTNVRHYPRDRQAIARELVARGCRTDILMATALGDIALVRRHLDANPDSIRMTVSDEYFPKRDPKSGGTIYYWTLGKDLTAHTVARDFGQDEIFALLVERSPADLRVALACELGDEATFRQMLARRPDLPKAEPKRLVDAAENNNLHAARLMLDAGWPVGARGTLGATALHWASFNGNAELVREILRHHPTVDIRGDHYDSTPLGWAMFGSKNSRYHETGDYPGVAEALLDAGAKAPAHEDDGQVTDAVRAVVNRYRS